MKLSKPTLAGLFPQQAGPKALGSGGGGRGFKRCIQRILELSTSGKAVKEIAELYRLNEGEVQWC